MGLNCAVSDACCRRRQTATCGPDPAAPSLVNKVTWQCGHALSFMCCLGLLHYHRSRVKAAAAVIQTADSLCRENVHGVLLWTLQFRKLGLFTFSLKHAESLVITLRGIYSKTF